MRYTRLPRKWMACLALAALVGGMWPAVRLSVEAQEAEDLPPTRLDGVFTVREGQMVRLSSHNLATETVQVAFGLVNFQGINLGLGVIDIPISLGPGKGTFVDIPGSAILGPNETRTEVTGIVRVVASNKARKAVGVNLAASLQVLDETTHGTVRILPFAYNLEVPDRPMLEGRAPIGSTVGVSQGQMVRQSAHNLSTETVQVAFGLVNFQGINLGVGLIDNPISLGPGKGTFVDIPGSAILGPNETRAEVTGIVRVVASNKAPRAAGVNLAASLQVLDETTHDTLLILPYINIACIIAPMRCY